MHSHIQLDDLCLNKLAPSNHPILQATSPGISGCPQFCSSPSLEPPGPWGHRLRPGLCVFQATDKRKALEETMAFATQALASVAYQVGNLAGHTLRMLDLQSTALRQVEARVSALGQVRLWAGSRFIGHSLHTRLRQEALPPNSNPAWATQSSCLLITLCPECLLGKVTSSPASTIPHFQGPHPVASAASFPPRS